MPASADAEQLDKLVEHVKDAKLPLIAPKDMYSGIVLAVGDIACGQIEIDSAGICDVL